MSYNFDGKIANQWTRRSTTPSKCSKCNKIINSPEIGQFNTYIKSDIKTEIDKAFVVQHYLNQPFFIYETKSGFAVVYCSDYCRRKHNHRFTK